MNLRILVPGVFSVMAVVITLLSEGKQELLENKVFLWFGAPSTILVVGWILNQGLRFYWSVFGVYHNSIYHDALREATGFQKKGGDYSVNLERVDLSLGGPVTKRQFEAMFDPFHRLPIPWGRESHLSKHKLPFVAPLDNFILYESTAKDAPGKRWTDIMLVVQFVLGVVVGWMLATSFDLSGNADDFSAPLSNAGPWLLAALGLGLVLPALLHATIVSWKEARAYELLAVLLRRGKKAGCNPTEP